MSNVGRDTIAEQQVGSADIIARDVGNDLDNPSLALENLFDSLCALEPKVCRWRTLRMLNQGETYSPVALINAFWRSCWKHRRLHQFVAG